MIKFKTYKGDITYLPPRGIFVFGSNTEGRHSKGAALTAKLMFGAEYGNPVGRQGQSYAIITKDLTKCFHPSVSRIHIENQILDLYDYAIAHPDLLFFVPYKDNQENLNYYTSKEMADMFSRWKIPDNMVFEESFSKLLTQCY
ncbi:gp296 [Sphingomonas phage PAU]|uniref:gp296 n=1 Tax=Sphingomonas phage PAU TaxID=1150991 RepID=UPI00025734A7|nr:gp296 [Sphingomonas phage PAU]AFF28293.1 gp296 [Sphingomonas phage PAU]